MLHGAAILFRGRVGLMGSDLYTAPSSIAELPPWTLHPLHLQNTTSASTQVPASSPRTHRRGAIKHATVFLPRPREFGELPLEK